MKQVAPSNLEAQLFGLSTLVQLVKRARHAATAPELAFVMVNETHGLVPYRQAVLWRRERAGQGRVLAISGGAVVERNAPMTIWLQHALAKLDQAQEPGPRRIGASDLSGGLGEDWSEWLPAHGLLLPLVIEPGRTLGVLLLAREQPWNEGEAHLLLNFGDGIGVDPFVGARAADVVEVIVDAGAAGTFTLFGGGRRRRLPQLSSDQRRVTSSGTRMPFS